MQLSYAIGVAEPIGFAVETYGTGRVPGQDFAAVLSAEFDLRPQAIIERLDLTRPQYSPLASGGHFGRTDLPAAWERGVE